MQKLPIAILSCTSSGFSSGSNFVSTKSTSSSSFRTYLNQHGSSLNPAPNQQLVCLELETPAPAEGQSCKVEGRRFSYTPWSQTVFVYPLVLESLQLAVFYLATFVGWLLGVQYVYILNYWVSELCKFAPPPSPPSLRRPLPYLQPHWKGRPRWPATRPSLAPRLGRSRK